MNEDEFLREMAMRNLGDQAKTILAWSASFPNHQKVFSSRSKRISFRLEANQGGRAFFTVILQLRQFKYLFNGIGVVMNNMENWHSGNYLLLDSNNELLEDIQANYRELVMHR